MHNLEVAPNQLEWKSESSHWTELSYLKVNLSIELMNKKVNLSIELLAFKHEGENKKFAKFKVQSIVQQVQ